MASTDSSSSDGSRRSSRRNSFESAPGSIAKTAPLKSVRRIKYCLDWPLPSHLICGGCTEYSNSFTGQKNKGFDRAKTHTHRKYNCKQPWKVDPEGMKEGDNRYDKSGGWIIKVHEYIKERFDCSLRRVIITPANHSSTKRAISQILLNNGDTPTSSITSGGAPSTATSNLEEEDGCKKKKTKEEVKLMTHIVSSTGYSFEVKNVPATHEIVLSAEMSRLRNADLQMKELRESFNNYRFSAKPLPFMKSLLSVALASSPTLPLYQAANIIPLVVAGFLVDLGLLFKANIHSFSKSFPSETYLRDMLFEYAAENSYELGRKLEGKLVFLSCDKGNKKGVGHFIKILSWYNTDTFSVKKQIVDIDASEGTTEACADAIAFSLKKLGGNLKLQGQTTDSGGGGVLDGLASALTTRHQLCRRNYLTASCSLYNLQTSVKNPIVTTIGEGGVDAKNAMQLLHAVYDLQQSMEKDVWNAFVTEALKFLEANVGQPYVGISVGDEQFANKWELVKTFRNFTSNLDDDDLKAVTLRIQAPVLTRWWTVGQCARLTSSIYLLLVRITQLVINASLANSRGSKIASGLQTLLLERQIYSDLCLIHCFHSVYVCPHFEWMQSATDLSDLPGFQAHNTLSRYYLMMKDLHDIQTTIDSNHEGFVDFRESLHGMSQEDRLHQQHKAQQFITIAEQSVTKHFQRWCSVSLLPAALLSEKPLASVVAAVMLKRNNIAFDPPLFHSEAHDDRVFDMSFFHNFVKASVQSEGQPATIYYDPMAIVAAQLLLDNKDFDLRDKEDYDPIKSYLLSAYLPLASHTQFVEAGVKEAKVVSQSDRSEQLRSAYAIIRSARIHSDGVVVRDLSSTQRIQMLMKSAKQHVESRQYFQGAHVDYNEQVNAIVTSMRTEHFKQERVEQLIATAINKGSINKKDNALQKRRGVDTTLVMMGLIPYGKLTKRNGHHEDLMTELLFRGCNEDEVKSMGITARKTKLRELELQRVVSDETGDNDETKKKNEATAQKAFKPLSAAAFNLNPAA